MASVLIEKPSLGLLPAYSRLRLRPAVFPAAGIPRGFGAYPFLPVGRYRTPTAADPAAERIVRNLLAYVESVPHAEGRVVFYTGNGQAKQLLEQLGVSFQQLGDQDLDSSSLLVLGPEVEAGGWTADRGRERCQPAVPWSIAGRAPMTSWRTACRPQLSNVIPSSTRGFDGNGAWQGISNADLHWRTTQLRAGSVASCG